MFCRRSGCGFRRKHHIYASPSVLSSQKSPLIRCAVPRVCFVIKGRPPKNGYGPTLTEKRRVKSIIIAGTGAIVALAPLVFKRCQVQRTASLQHAHIGAP